jgi:hypothetical protein
MIIVTQALAGLESFITMICHRFPKFYNALQYATYLKKIISENKNRGYYVKLYLFKYIQSLLLDYFEACVTILMKN